MKGDPIGPNVAVLEQTLRLLDMLDDDQYVHVESRLSSASIGAHVRHNLDHYRLFLEGQPTGTVDYDLRERDTIVQTDRAAAAELTRELITSLRALPAFALEQRLHVRQQGSYEKGRFDECESRVDRELLFLQSHAVHHFALVAILARAQGLALPETFGMAPSTVDWLAGRAAVPASGES